MTRREHEGIARWERRWLSVSGLMSLFFVLLIAYSLAFEGAHIAQRSARTTPDQLTQNPLFAEPGIRIMAPNQFQVTAVAQAFAFLPAEIRLPVGAEVDFFLTSRDVIHGFQIEDTNVNVEVLPGEISYLHYRFDDVGEFRLTCNEYCGISHQNMLGKVVVVPASQYARAVTPEATADVGEQVFTSNCAACHQANGEGISGAFPPVRGHINAILAAEGGRAYSIQLLLNGLQGAIEVAGNTYNGIMPGWRQLSDEQIAAVLNYSLRLGETQDNFQPFEPSEIAEARKQTLNANDVYALRQSLNLGGQ
ncbi:MAG: c-type cytochrome [Trueperaceae bacterium]